MSVPPSVGRLRIHQHREIHHNYGIKVPHHRRHHRHHCHRHRHRRRRHHRHHHRRHPRRYRIRPRLKCLRQDSVKEKNFTYFLNIFYLSFKILSEKRNSLGEVSFL